MKHTIITFLTFTFMFSCYQGPTVELTITIPFPVKRDLNLFATEIFNKSVIKYERSTIEKNKTKLVNDLPLAGDETMVTPPQKMNTPTFRMFMANPFAASPK